MACPGFHQIFVRTRISHLTSLSPVLNIYYKQWRVKSGLTSLGLTWHDPAGRFPGKQTWVSMLPRFRVFFGFFRFFLVFSVEKPLETKMPNYWCNSPPKNAYPVQTSRTVSFTNHYPLTCSPTFMLIYTLTPPFPWTRKLVNYNVM